MRCKNQHLVILNCQGENPPTSGYILFIFYHNKQEIGDASSQKIININIKSDMREQIQNN